MVDINDRSPARTACCGRENPQDPLILRCYELVTGADATAGRVLRLLAEEDTTTSSRIRFLLLHLGADDHSQRRSGRAADGQAPYGHRPDHGQLGRAPHDPRSTAEPGADDAADGRLTSGLGEYAGAALAARLARWEHAGLAKRMELSESTGEHRPRPGRFDVVYIPSPSVTLIDEVELDRALAMAHDLLVPGGLVIVATQYALADTPVHSMLTVGRGVTMIEDIDPAAGDRRVVVRCASRPEQSVRLRLVAPATVLGAMKKHGLRPTYQHFHPHPRLLHDRDVLIAARKGPR